MRSRRCRLIPATRRSRLAASESRKNFFFEKKKQKTFIIFGLYTARKQKFFGARSRAHSAFFQKRTFFTVSAPGQEVV
jgi:putative SOS response-associated peptidase YedK